MTISAIDAYNAMLRDAVSPEVRRMGLRGNGGRYHLPDETLWLLVRSSASDLAGTPRRDRGDERDRSSLVGGDLGRMT